MKMNTSGKGKALEFKNVIYFEQVQNLSKYSSLGKPFEFNTSWSLNGIEICKFKKIEYLE